MDGLPASYDSWKTATPRSWDDPAEVDGSLCCPECDHGWDGEDMSVLDYRSDRYSWEADVEAKCPECGHEFRTTVGQEADFESMAEARAEARAEW